MKRATDERSSKDYFQLLKSPKWQKKRLEVFQKHKFQCEGCGETKEQLSVHHCYYEKEKLPWEYPDHCYKVFCEDCHKEWHENKSFIDHVLSELCLDELDLLTGLLINPDERNKVINYASFAKAERELTRMRKDGVIV